MATPTNAVSTVEINGKREDLIDVIYNIAPYDTPFMAAIGKTTAEAITHEWQTDDLRSGQANKRVEGEDATIKAGSFTTLLNNYCQISDETLQVTGTADRVKKAGRKNELAYQLAKKSKELKLDIEYALVGAPQAKIQRSTTVAGQMANIFAYYKTNGSLGAGGVAPAGTGADTGTAGTLRSLTEDMLLDASEKIWNEGGTANQIQTSSTLKKAISKNFKGRATEITLDSADNTISTAVDVYETDFGKYTITANRNFAANTLFMFDPKMHSLAYLRPFFQQELAKSGDSEKRQLLVEYTFRVNNEKSGALIRDVQA
ncbi:major head protein [Pseudomonas phage Bjorn]|uniref:Capsid protein n=1 Tax=Pseudomonas phage Bjorn TaxID=2079288 RepID=A0A2K9VHC7_9CAUD|nr:major head protein [Pseudomonas phage Bjorn]AUV61751.1 capsid protein [Pseudomonas phage Bjorn]